VKRSELKQIIKAVLREEISRDPDDHERGDNDLKSKSARHESQEVVIGRKILKLAQTLELNVEFYDGGDAIERIIELSKKLIDLHKKQI
jgi:hypothetical protein